MTDAETAAARKRHDMERRSETLAAIRNRAMCRILAAKLPADDRYGQWLRGEG